MRREKRRTGGEGGERREKKRREGRREEKEGRSEERREGDWKERGEGRCTLRRGKRGGEERMKERVMVFTLSSLMCLILLMISMLLIQATLRCLFSTFTIGSSFALVGLLI